MKDNSKFPPFPPLNLRKSIPIARSSKCHDPPKTKYVRVLVSKRYAVIIHRATKYVPTDNMFKCRHPLKPLRTLLIHDINGRLTPRWVKRLKPVQREPQSITLWALRVQQLSLLRSLGCNPKPPLLPSRFKLLKVPYNPNLGPSKSNKPWLKHKLRKLYPLRLPKGPPDPSLDSVTFIISFRLSAHSSPLVIDDTPPLVNYWSDSSSDNSDDLNTMNVLDSLEFVGRGPKPRKVKKDGKTVAGVFRPL